MNTYIVITAQICDEGRNAKWLQDPSNRSSQIAELDRPHSELLFFRFQLGASTVHPFYRSVVSTNPYWLTIGNKLHMWLSLMQHSPMNLTYQNSEVKLTDTELYISNVLYK